MKNSPLILALVLALALLLVMFPAPVRANGIGLTVNGKWAGTAFAAPFDLNGDGIPARTFQARAYSQLAFTAVEGIADSALIALPGQGSCTDPAALELQALGKLTFRGYGGDAVFTSFDALPHLCFNPAAPNEVLSFTVTGGTGIYAGRTGSGTATLHDIVLQASPAGALLMIDSQAEFTLTLH